MLGAFQLAELRMAAESAGLEIDYRRAWSFHAEGFEDVTSYALPCGCCAYAVPSSAKEGCIQFGYTKKWGKVAGAPPITGQHATRTGVRNRHVVRKGGSVAGRLMEALQIMYAETGVRAPLPQGRRLRAGALASAGAADGWVGLAACSPAWTPLQQGCGPMAQECEHRRLSGIVALAA